MTVRYDKCDRQAEVIKLVELAEGLNVPVQIVSKLELDQKAAGLPHQVTKGIGRIFKLHLQNVALIAGPLMIPQIQNPDDWMKDLEPNAKILALDGLVDPRNVGTIIRSAYFLGASAVIMDNRHRYILWVPYFIHLT